MPSFKPSWAIAGVGLIAAGVGGYFLLNKPAGGPQEVGAGAPSSGAASAAAQARAPASAASGPRPSAVEVANVEKASLQDDAQAVGNLRARQSTLVRPEVAGRVAELGFTDGQTVRRGQMLVQFDDVLQRAEVRQARAQVGIAQANVQRNKELAAQSFVAQRVVDESLANQQVAEAQMSLVCARLSRMRLDAPFDGVVGIRNVNVGDYLREGADVVNLEDMSTMLVDFRLPERFQNKIKRGQTVELQLEAFPGRMFQAKVEALDPALDANARSIGVRASLPNSAGQALAQQPRPGASSQSALTSGPANANRVAPRSVTKPVPKPVLSGVPHRASAPAAAPRALSEEQRWCEELAMVASKSTRSLVAGATKPAALRVGAAVGSAGGPLRPGMFARATAIFAIKDSALVVPEEALVPFAGRQFVIKVVDKSAVPGTATAALPAHIKEVSLRQEVRVGVRRAGKVEVEVPTGAAGSLAEGDVIVTAGQQRLQRDGSPVRVVDLSRPAAAAAPATSAPAGVAAISASGASK
jgi:membrane fusion protein (multidrug efflux system)